MRIPNWLRPGAKVKRWILLGILGLVITSFGLGKLIDGRFRANLAVFYLISAAGAAIIIISYKFGMKSVLRLISDVGVDACTGINKLSSLVYEKRLLIKGPKIVVIGGGTGLSTMLRGLKHYTSNLTAIVTVADDGGGSGVLREELGILPPGDIRNCLLSLADTEPVMENLLQYRFTDGMLKGQSFGNLFIAAMNGISDNFEEAIKKMSEVLAVTGQVLPVTLSDVKLFAELEDGTIVKGESEITKRTQNVPIKRVFIEPSNVYPLDEAVNAIREADAIVFGPGSLYTSIIPNLLVDDIARHIEDSGAVKIYVSNIMTQPGETIGYSVCDHIDAIHKYCRKRIINYVIANDGKIPRWLYGKYIEEGAQEVNIDRNNILKENIKLVEDNLVYVHNNLVRHNTNKLARLIIDIVLNERISKDKKRTLEYYYLNERLKERRI
ncbi:MAG: YvcK family protein [Clostridiales bacterium]|nr:YvcK family protein [Clostridiales bacterium]